MGAPVRSTSEARGASREPHRKTPTPSDGAVEWVAVGEAEDLAASVSGRGIVPRRWRVRRQGRCVVTETGAATTSAPLNPRWEIGEGSRERGRRRDGMTLDRMRAGSARRRTSPRSSELLCRRLKIENTATRRQSQAARREALQSVVKLIRRRFGAGAARIAGSVRGPRR